MTMCLAMTLNLTRTAFHTSSESPEPDDGLGGLLLKETPCEQKCPQIQNTPLVSAVLKYDEQARGGSGV